MAANIKGTSQSGFDRLIDHPVTGGDMSQDTKHSSAFEEAQTAARTYSEKKATMSPTEKMQSLMGVAESALRAQDALSERFTTFSAARTLQMQGFRLRAISFDQAGQRGQSRQDPPRPSSAPPAAS
jgi:hypothetical protein